MSIDSDQPSLRINPRPGIVKTLGICNIVFSAMLGLCLMGSTFWLVAMTGRSAQMSAQVPAATGPPAQPVARPVIAFDPFMGMDDIRFIRFCYVDVGTALLLNGLMFATGIGLLNLKGWGARWWTALAWAKVLRLVLLWGFYIVSVAPGLSENMARSVSAMFQQQGIAPGKGPNVGDLTRVYSIMNLILAVGMIVLGSVYPLISLWVLSRPRVKAALVDKPAAMEPELP